MILALLGVALGFAGAYFVGRGMQTMLVNVGKVDPITFSAVAMLLLAAAILACYVPARRATRVDPVQACARSNAANQTDLVVQLCPRVRLPVRAYGGSSVLNYLFLKSGLDFGIFRWRTKSEYATFPAWTNPEKTFFRSAPPFIAAPRLMFLDEESPFALRDALTDSIRKAEILLRQVDACYPPAAFPASRAKSSPFPASLA